MIAYWFSKEDGTSEYNTNPAEIGRTDTVESEIKPCLNGLHGSPTPFDGLGYAYGPIMWEVELGGTVVPHGDPIDKYASSIRKYLRRVDLTRVMRQFAAKQALSVRNLWKMPSIVSEYLEAEADGIDRSDIRTAAWYAARAATCDAAWYAARAATCDAAWYAACDAAWYAARDAACDAARDAAWDATCDAAWYATWDAACNVAWYAARAAACDAARAAARQAARDQFNQMALEALEAQ